MSNQTLISLTNAELQGLSQSRALLKLQQATELRAGVKFAVLKWIKKIFAGPEYQACEETRKELIDRLQKKWEELPEPGRPNLDTYLREEPEVIEFLNTDSGIEIEKLCIPVDAIPASITVEDMLQVDKYIDWQE